MIVQFEDRADTTRILFPDRAWMDFIELVREGWAKQHFFCKFG
jgi:hypothetical protein